MEFAKQPADVRKLQQEIKKREWDVNLVDSSQGADSEVSLLKRAWHEIYTAIFIFISS
jgi:hypothetical protein